jgi:hypothetical protein
MPRDAAVGRARLAAIRVAAARRRAGARVIPVDQAGAATTATM